MRFARQLALLILVAAGCLAGGSADGVAGARVAEAAAQPSHCPSRSDLDAALGQASTLLQQSRFQDATALLKPLSANDCDARASLLLAAALESQGDERQATEQLQHAHAVWPLNNSVSATLARLYLAGGEKDQAAKALDRFHPTAETPEQESKMAVVVCLATNRLQLAETFAERNYKYHPSLSSLLLVANALQMQGRYPDVNRLLGSKRDAYRDSPEFLVTLAESEYDASIFPAARDDLKRAISLNPGLYQSHYLLGNVLSRLNDADGAIAEYRLAIDLAPQQPRTYYQLALVLRAKQDDAGERTALEQALAADSGYAPAQCELGRLLLDDEHRPADAESHLLAAIEYNPRDEEAYYLLARAYTKLGEKEKAGEIVKRLRAVREQNRLQTGKNGGNPASTK